MCVCNVFIFIINLFNYSMPMCGQNDRLSWQLLGAFDYGPLSTNIYAVKPPLYTKISQKLFKPSEFFHIFWDHAAETLSS